MKNINKSRLVKYNNNEKIQIEIQFTLLSVLY